MPDLSLNELDSRNLFDKFHNATHSDFSYDEILSQIDITCNYIDLEQCCNMYKNAKGIKMLSWNVRSLNKNFNELKELIDILAEYKIIIEVIALQEIWQISDNDTIRLDNYNFICAKRGESEIGGGVGFYIHKSLKFKKVEKLSIFESRLFESISIEIQINTRKKIVCSNIYRPPTIIAGFSQASQLNYFIDKFSSLQAQMSELHCDSYILTDTNIDLLKFNQYDYIEQFLENNYANAFLPLVSKPTRVVHQSCSLIDNIFTNALSYNFKSCILTLSVSDHFPILHFTANLNSNKQRDYISFRNFEDEKIEQFVSIMNDCNWQNVLECNNPEESFNLFFSEFNDTFNVCFPITKKNFNKNIHNIEPFMSKGLLISRNKKFSLHSKKVRNPTAINTENYMIYRRMYNKLVRAAKQNYFHKSLKQNKANLRKTWQILKEAMKKCNDKSSVIDELRFDDNIYTSKLDISNKMNDFFVSIPSQIASQINPSNIDPMNNIEQNDSRFSLDNVTHQQIIDLVKGMENKKSCDMFDISNYFLKKTINTISIPLCHIFNSSINHGIVPSKLKCAKVIPIFKLKSNLSNDRYMPKNYRPISLLPIFSKILEKIIHIQLVNYLDDNNIIYNHQYGFMSKRSTVHPLIHFINKLGMARNEKLISIGVFCDVARGFDTLCHNILIKKLEKIGIHGRELQWFKSYLTGRKQYVYVNGVKSSTCTVSTGVPQGSLLGPILFLIYINDLPKVTSLFTLLYADDTSFLISGKSLEEITIILNTELKKVCDWFRSNKLSLHPEKTKFMVFNKNENNINWNEINIQLNFNNGDDNIQHLITKLGFVNSSSEIPAIKFLGVYIDPNTNFRYHIKYIRRKILNSIFVLKRLKNFLPQESLRTLYFSLVHSHINYCLPVWSSCLPSDLNAILLLQKKAVRIVTNSSYNEHTPPLFKQLGILPIVELSDFSKLQVMHDYINGKLPLSFENMWLKNYEVNANIRRNRDQFYLHLIRFKAIEKFPIFYFQKLWNEKCDNGLLNSDISKKVFSRNLKLILMINICKNSNCHTC